MVFMLHVTTYGVYLKNFAAFLLQIKILNTSPTTYLSTKCSFAINKLHPQKFCRLNCTKVTLFTQQCYVYQATLAQ